MGKARRGPAVKLGFLWKSLCIFHLLSPLHARWRWNGWRKQLISEAQNSWGWQGPLEMVQPNPSWPKWSHLEQGNVQSGFEYPQGWWWRLHNLSGAPVPVFDCPHSFWPLNGIFYLCSPCLFTFHWTPLRRVWLHLPHLLPSGVYW